MHLFYYEIQVLKAVLREIVSSYLNVEFRQESCRADNGAIQI